jgi:hypothetical protein
VLNLTRVFGPEIAGERYAKLSNTNERDKENNSLVHRDRASSRIRTFIIYSPLLGTTGSGVVLA